LGFSGWDILLDSFIFNSHLIVLSLIVIAQEEDNKDD
jgi:hypothetical protein